MPNQPSTFRPYKFVANGGLLVALGAANVQQTGLKKSAHYRFTAVGGGALISLDGSASTIADNGFDLALGDMESIDVVVPGTTADIIEANADSSANAVVLIQELDMAA